MEFINLISEILKNNKNLKIFLDMDGTIVENIFDGIVVEWDSKKAELVIKEHGVSFDEALTVLLYDDNALTNEDVRGYDGEQRFITIGVSSYGRLLYVAWTLRDIRYRLISARKANRHEQKGYQNA